MTSSDSAELGSAKSVVHRALLLRSLLPNAYTQLMGPRRHIENRKRSKPITAHLLPGGRPQFKVDFALLSGDPGALSIENNGRHYDFVVDIYRLSR